MIWFMPICSECEMETQYQSWLPSLPPERQKKSLRYRFIKDRWLCAAAYMLLMHALHEEGIPASQEWRVCTTDLGKPYFEDHPHVHFNLSHCAAGVACIIADVPVGIDIEVRRIPDRNIIKKILSESEQCILAQSDDPAGMFTQMWTLKESWLKAKGYGLSFAPAAVITTEADDGRLCVVRDGYVGCIVKKTLDCVIATCCPAGKEDTKKLHNVVRFFQ